MDGNGPPEPHRSQGEDPSGYQAEEGQIDHLEYFPPSFDDTRLSKFKSHKTKRWKTINQLNKLKAIPGKPTFIKRSKPAAQSSTSPFSSIRPDWVNINYPNVSISSDIMHIWYNLSEKSTLLKLIVILSRVESRNLSV